MRAVYMADWMANAICDADMKQDEGIKEVRNYVFSFAKEMGFEDYVAYDENMGRYYATYDMDDEPVTRGLIERYEEHSVWENLSSWLGERDFFKKYSLEEIKEMDDKERFIKRMECEIFWGKEFEKRGIERLFIKKSK